MVYYGLPVNKSVIRSQGFITNRFLTKLKLNDTEIIRTCKEQVNFNLPFTCLSHDVRN